MHITVDGIDFDVDVNVDQEIESRALIVEVTGIFYESVEVSDIINPALVTKIEDAAHHKVEYGY